MKELLEAPRVLGKPVIFHGIVDAMEGDKRRGLIVFETYHSVQVGLGGAARPMRIDGYAWVQVPDAEEMVLGKHAFVVGRVADEGVCRNGELRGYSPDCAIVVEASKFIVKHEK